VMGSSNFDFLSFNVQQDVIAIVRNRRVIEQYRKDVLEPDLASSVEPTRVVSPAWQSSRARLFDGIGQALVALSRIGPGT